MTSKKPKEKPKDIIKKLRPGSVVDAKDAAGNWFEARVVDVDTKGGVEVCFHGQDEPTKQRQWCEGDHIDPHRTHTSDAWRTALERGDAKFVQCFVQSEGSSSWAQFAVSKCTVKPGGEKVLDLIDPRGGSSVWASVELMSESLREDLPPDVHRKKPKLLPLTEAKKKDLRARQQAQANAEKALLQPHLVAKGFVDRKPQDELPPLWFARPFPKEQSTKDYILCLREFFPAEEDGRPAFSVALAGYVSAWIGSTSPARKLHRFYAHSAAAGDAEGLLGRLRALLVTPEIDKHGFAANTSLIATYANLRALLDVRECTCLGGTCVHCTLSNLGHAPMILLILLLLNLFLLVFFLLFLVLFLPQAYGTFGVR